MTTLPSIGYRAGINAESILALRPSLFIVEKGYVEDAVVKQIRSAGARVVEIPRALIWPALKKIDPQYCEGTAEVDER